MPTSLSQDELAALFERIIDDALKHQPAAAIESAAASDELLGLHLDVQVRFTKTPSSGAGFSRADICCICYRAGDGDVVCRGTCCQG